MMNTLSLFPRKTAQPPLVGNTARTCTSMTVLFIRANRNRVEEEKQASGCFVIVLVLVIENEDRSSRSTSTSTITKRSRQKFPRLRACMCTALIDYALCGGRR